MIDSYHTGSAHNLHEYFPLGKSIIQVYCKDGQLIKALQDLGYKANGFTNDEKDIKEAQEKGIHIEKADLRGLPVGYKAFDVFLLIAPPCLWEIEPICKEAQRVTGGIILFSFNTTNNRGKYLEIFEELLPDFELFTPRSIKAPFDTECLKNNFFYRRKDWRSCDFTGKGD